MIAIRAFLSGAQKYVEKEEGLRNFQSFQITYWRGGAQKIGKKCSFFGVARSYTFVVESNKIIPQRRRGAEILFLTNQRLRVFAVELN